MEKESVEGTKKKVKQPKEHHIVGIGASAGGLDALNVLFENTPNDSASYVIIQHLSPDHKSLMKELLARHTTLQIEEAKEGMKVKQNSIYVMPNDKYLTIKNKTLYLEDRPPRDKESKPVDLFLESLAEDMGKNAIGVILSGAGSDGSEGILAIKNKGGLTIAQDPVSAAFDNMPASAIKSGCIDLVLTPEQIPEEVDNYITHPEMLDFYGSESLNRKGEVILLDILNLVREQTSRDFLNYKRPTIIRRLKRRMLHNNFTDIADYKKFLFSHPEEIEALCNDFLINVTRFFRDTDAFNEIAASVIPAIFRDRREKEPVKIWVAGCCTGEEAYSLAILIQEYLDKMQRNDEVKIFASDIDKIALEKAGKGIYPARIEKDVSPLRLNNFFTRQGEDYKVIPSLRKMLVFAEHDLINDPPFSKIDLLSCRNLLIYLNPEAQRKLIATFNFSLKRDGFLWLGISESAGVLKPAFDEVNGKLKIFRNRPTAESHKYPVGERILKQGIQLTNLPRPAGSNSNDFADVYSSAVMNEYGASGVFIKEDFTIVHAIGNFKKFLHLPEKISSLNILKMVPEDLSIALSTAVQKVYKSQEKLIVKDIKVRHEGMERNINVSIAPAGRGKGDTSLLLVLFTEGEHKKMPQINEETFDKDKYFNDRIADLEEELINMKLSLQTAIELKETTNEELQSSNEELLSANEELQSTNEELQSLNEELNTVNNEHRLKIHELVELNDDLNNYFRASDFSQIFVDKKLNLRKFSLASVKEINLLPGDIGRPIRDLSINLHYDNFIRDLESILKGEDFIEKEMQTHGGKWVLMRMVPYLTHTGKIDGVVITFVDISRIKKLNFFVTGVLNSSSSGIMGFKAVRNSEGKISDFQWLLANENAKRMIGKSGYDLDIKYLLHEMPQVREEGLLTLLISVCEEGNTLYKEHHYTSMGQDRWFMLGIGKMDDGIVLTFEDITQRKLAERNLEIHTRELEDKNAVLEQWASLATNELQEPLRAVSGFSNHLLNHLQANLDADGKDMLSYVSYGIEQMQNMILDLKEFTEIEKSDRPFQSLNAKLVIQYGKTYLFGQIQNANAKIIYDTELPEITGDITQLSLLFQHLLSNAIKFVRKGEEPVIHIGAKDENDYWVFYIKDNGIGLNMKFKARIFKIFQRLNSRHEYPGAGIGLSISKRILQRHKGRIWVESIPGEGSTFYFSLPK